MKLDIVISGVGGQGILTIAGLLAQAALQQGWNVKQSEIHGMAQRGGAVEANLRLSQAPIFSDLIARGTADAICAMEPLEALRYLPMLKPEGWVLTSSDPVASIHNYPALDVLQAELEQLPHRVLLPAGQMAKDAGSNRAANMVMLGALSALTPFPTTVFESIITHQFKGKGDAVVAANLKAFAAGRQASTSVIKI